MSEMNSPPTLGMNPVMTNGRTTYNTYLVVAVRKEVKIYNAVGVRKLGNDEYKFHLWPSDRAVGAAAFIEENFPGRKYTRHAGLSATEYTGLVLNTAETEKFLDFLKSNENLLVAPRQQIMDLLNGNIKVETIIHNETNVGHPGSFFDTEEDGD